MDSLEKPKKPAISPINGAIAPVSRQFGQPNGNIQHRGAWKKDESPRGKMEKLLQMDKFELEHVAESEANFESTIARLLLRLRHCADMEELNPRGIEATVRSLERLINQVYGMPKESIEHDVKGEVLTVVLPRFDDKSQI